MVSYPFGIEGKHKKGGSMALTPSDIARLKSLTDSIARCDKDLLTLSAQQNKKIQERNKYVDELNRINRKR